MNESELKSREKAEACQACHEKMVVKGSRIPPPEQGLMGFAPGYMDAMHGLCISCHEEVEEKENKLHHSRCDTCHRLEIEPVDTAQFVIGNRAVPGSQPQ